MKATAAPELRAAEDELQVLRGQLADAAAFINDPAYDIAARQNLASRLGLPGPRTTDTRKDTSHAG